MRGEDAAHGAPGTRAAHGARAAGAGAHCFRAGGRELRARRRHTARFVPAPLPDSVG